MSASSSALTDAQLGRIARAVAGRPFDEPALWRAAAGDLAGALEDVSVGEDVETEPMRVLREVAAEVERARAVCEVSFMGQDGDPALAEWDGHEILTRAANHFRWFCATWCSAIRITNEAHGIEWTWQRESER